MLEIQTSAEDLARVRVAGSAGVAGETLLAMAAVRRPGHDPWAARARRAQSPADQLIVRYLRPLRTVGVDLVTLGGLAADRDTAVAVLLDCSSAWFGDELSMFARTDGARPAWAAAAHRGDRAAHHQAVRSVMSWHDRHLAHRWSGVRAELDVRHALLAHHLASGGVDHLLRHLGPGITWDGRTIRLPAGGEWSPDPVRAHLGGRGLVVVPSWFAVEPEAYFPIDTSAPAILITPVRRRDGSPRTGTRDLGAALGRTRAAVLIALSVRPSSTSELAARLGVSLSGVSQHAAALRAAGLVSTTREGGSVRHTVTAVGRAMSTFSQD